VFVPVSVKPSLAEDQRVYDARDAAKPTAVTAVPTDDMPKVARNAELESLVAAMRETQALRSLEYQGGSSRAVGASEASGEESEQREVGEDGLLVVGDLEDDFIMSVLDADALAPQFSADASVLDTLPEDDEDDEGSDYTDRVSSKRGYASLYPSVVSHRLTPAGWARHA